LHVECRDKPDLNHPLHWENKMSKKVNIGWSNHPDNWVTVEEARQIANEAGDWQVVSVAREAAKQPMNAEVRGNMIDALCERLDAMDRTYRKAHLALYEGLAEVLEGLTCLHGTCDHYTCTEGQALAEWEYNNNNNRGGY